VTAPGPGQSRPTLGSAFDPRRNSLNFLRLVLATMVVVSHAVTLGGFGSEWILNKTTLGVLAVYGFFGISGYLIASSAAHNSVGRYLWQRFLRIMPGYWVCLVFTGFVLGAIAWHQTHLHCGFLCYSQTRGGPGEYVYRDALLRQPKPGIAGTLSATPLRHTWNGSLWTLYYEALCYLAVAALSLTRLFRRRGAVLGLTLALWISEVIAAFNETRMPGFGVWALWTLMPIFFTGSVLYLYRDLIPDAGFLAFACTALAFGGLWLPLPDGYNHWITHASATSITAPLFAYPLLWLGVHLPFQRIGARNDYSYGIYIYAFPVQQLLASNHVYRWGYLPYLLMSLVCTLALATASWWLVEKRAIAYKKARLGLPRARRRRRRPSPEQVLLSAAIEPDEPRPSRT
jgi:peptidoglycan/LPS O-acetylase OafA/YrhL